MDSGKDVDLQKYNHAKGFFALCMGLLTPRKCCPESPEKLNLQISNSGIPRSHRKSKAGNHGELRH